MQSTSDNYGYPGPSPHQGGSIADLIHNFNTAIASIIQRANTQRFHESLGQLVLICLLMWLISALDDFLDSGLSGKLSVWGVIGDAALNYFWFAAVAAIC